MLTNEATAWFLGHYLVQAVTHWNRRLGNDPVRLTVFDNFSRGPRAT